MNTQGVGSPTGVKFAGKELHVPVVGGERVSGGAEKGGGEKRVNRELSIGGNLANNSQNLVRRDVTTTTSSSSGSNSPREGVPLYKIKNENDIQCMTALKLGCLDVEIDGASFHALCYLGVRRSLLKVGYLTINSDETDVKRLKIFPMWVEKLQIKKTSAKEIKVESQNTIEEIEIETADRGLKSLIVEEIPSLKRFKINSVGQFDVDLREAANIDELTMSFGGGKVVLNREQVECLLRDGSNWSIKSKGEPIFVYEGSEQGELIAKIEKAEDCPPKDSKELPTSVVSQEVTSLLEDITVVPLNDDVSAANVSLNERIYKLWNAARDGIIKIKNEVDLCDLLQGVDNEFGLINLNLIKEIEVADDSLSDATKKYLCSQQCSHIPVRLAATACDASVDSKADKQWIEYRSEEGNRVVRLKYGDDSVPGLVIYNNVCSGNVAPFANCSFSAESFRFFKQIAWSIVVIVASRTIVHAIS